MSEDVQQLENQFDAVERDAQALVKGLSENQGAWHAGAASWSVAECLDHLAAANRVYLQAMQAPAVRAREQGQSRRRPALPSVVGRLFVWSLEPPVAPRFRTRAPRRIQPRTAPALADAFAMFKKSQDEVRAFVREYADIDLASVRFPNPFVGWLRFSLATGLHVIPAHERRHLWQAWGVRRAAEAAARQRTCGTEPRA